MTPEAVTAIGKRAEAMLDALALISADPGRLTRLYLTEEHRRAARLVAEWMRSAGLKVRMDAAGTVHGLLPAAGDGPLAGKRLLVGSHIDTVVDAGRYDGTFGVVAGILAVEELRRRSVALPFGLEVLAFGDEEGVRFPKTLIGSSVVAGALRDPMLDLTDAEGVTIRAALAAFGGDPDALDAEAYRPEDTLGYVEAHIEQGPVLERLGLPLGVVTSIAGQARFRIIVKGEAGHAGTVPMAIRRDALTAAAEMILAIEAIGMIFDIGHAGEEVARTAIVATVGEVKVLPGAGNVIPGEVRFSLDLRAAEDAVRVGAEAEIRQRIGEIAARRNVDAVVETVHEKPVATCAPAMVGRIGTAIGRVTGGEAHRMMSGAGHDGQAMCHLGPIGMIFVRCRGGISHNPAEYASPEDMGLAVVALVETIIATSG
ncbi:MAG: allantoate amidohydrolase [Bauldia sp.]|nr:allantoate amidohydrolase [Bauldia sp.]